MFGMLCGGWITDRVFGGRAARACFFYMIGCTVGACAVLDAAESNVDVSTGLLCLAGFLHLWSAKSDRHRCREPGHKARRRGRGRPHRPVRLPEHDTFRRRHRRSFSDTVRMQTAAFEKRRCRPRASRRRRIIARLRSGMDVLTPAKVGTPASRRSSSAAWSASLCSPCAGGEGRMGTQTTTLLKRARRVYRSAPSQTSR